MLGTLGQLSASQAARIPPRSPKPNAMMMIQQVWPVVLPFLALKIVFQPLADPLRDLVLESLAQNNPARLSVLAAQAANLPDTEEIVSCPSTATTSVKNLAGIFAGTGNFVKKIEEKVKKKKYAVLECSDSESFGGKCLIWAHFQSKSERF